MNSKISIIVPVYNVQDYLRECLDSLVNQTFRDIEIICVNDGSTDNSLEILNEYAQKDSRIVVINQGNGGVSRARNTALDAVTGEYIMFCDPDDCFRLYACEEAYNAISRDKTDVCIYGYDRMTNDTIEPCSKNKIIDDIVHNKIKPDYTRFLMLWERIIKTSTIKRYNIRFYDSLKTAEDTVFLYELFFNKDLTYSFLNKSLYIYRFGRPKSLTANTQIVQRDFEALKTLYTLPMYQIQSEEIKNSIIKRFCFNAKCAFLRFEKSIFIFKIIKDIKSKIKFIEEHHSQEDLIKLSEYNEIKQIIKTFLYLIIKSFFFKPKTYSNDFETYLKEIKFEKYLKQLKKKIGKKTVIMYGSGVFYQYITDNFDLSEINIIGISDMKFTEEQEGEIYQNLKIIPKDKIINYNPNYVIVATKNYENIVKDFKSNLFNKTKIKVLSLTKKN